MPSAVSEAAATNLVKDSFKSLLQGMVGNLLRVRRKGSVRHDIGMGQVPELEWAVPARHDFFRVSRVGYEQGNYP